MADGILIGPLSNFNQPTTPRCEAQITWRHGDIPPLLGDIPKVSLHYTLVLWSTRNICQSGISGACRHSEFKAEMHIIFTPIVTL